MSAIENPLSLLSFDQPSSIVAVPIVPSYATANKIPVPLGDGITSSFKSPNAVLPNSLASIVSNGMTPPPSYRESSLYAAGSDPNVNAQGLPIIHILSKQPLPRSQWVGTSHVASPPISDLKPFLSEGVSWKKILIVLLIIFLVVVIILGIHLLYRDSKRCDKATTLGTSRNKSKLLGTAKTETSATTGSSLFPIGSTATSSSSIPGASIFSTKNTVGPSRSEGFSRLLRPGPQVQSSTGPLTPIVEKPEEENSLGVKVQASNLSLASSSRSRSPQLVV
jgi:hypothetical protein